MPTKRMTTEEPVAPKKVMRRVVSSSANRSKANTDYTDLESRILPVTQLEIALCLMLYGRSGSGKTTFMATLPKPILYMDLNEKGTDSICNVEGIDVIPVKDWDDVETIYWYLKANKKGYKSVVIDTLTQAQDLALRSAMVENGKKPDEAVSKRDFGIASGKMKTWILNYRDLIDEGIVVGFIAQDRTSQGEDDSDGDLSPEVGPRLMPSVASHANAAVNVIGHSFIQETVEKGEGRPRRIIQYGMRVGPHAYYLTKIRKPKEILVPQSIIDPSYEKLIDVIKGQAAEADSTPRKKVRRKA